MQSCIGFSLVYKLDPHRVHAVLRDAGLSRDLSEMLLDKVSDNGSCGWWGLVTCIWINFRSTVAADLEGHVLEHQCKACEDAHSPNERH